MCTRGYYIFVYKSQYYVFYNHWDSYPSVLGELIVNELRDIGMSGLAKWKTQLDNIIEKETEDYLGCYGLYKALENPYKHNVQITKKKPEHDNVEWMYFIDLDKMRFKVTGGCVDLDYPIYNIPRDWYRPLID